MKTQTQRTVDHVKTGRDWSYAATGQKHQGLPGAARDKEISSFRCLGRSLVLPAP